ncbi:MAG TPA: PfkB family carbohydrate kinase [Rectinemataceae bacterium]|nr:PfkB family carbohydrate kinase [Rectinemataceae bacterium]
MSSQNKGIMALGHILVDGIGSASEALLARLGDLPSPAHIPPGDMEALCAFIRRGEGVGEMSWNLGGGVAITAKAAIALGLKSEVWASVGRDRHGLFLARELTKAGVVARLFESGKPTGVFCSFTIASGGKKIVVSPGAARDIRGLDIPAGAFHPAWIFYVDGLLIDRPDWLIEQAIKAKKAGMAIAMDLSTPANARAHGVELVEFAQEFCDIVFANEMEFDALGVLPERGAEAGTTWVVKKAGKGASALSGGRWIDAPVSETEPIDDTGAGDTFSAGFLAAFIQGFDGAQCLRFGNIAAATALRCSGSNFDTAVMKREFDAQRLAYESIK